MPLEKEKKDVGNASTAMWFQIPSGSILFRIMKQKNAIILREACLDLNYGLNAFLCFLRIKRGRKFLMCAFLWSLS